MTARPPDTGTVLGGDARAGDPPPRPRWVKVSGVLLAVLVLAVVAMVLFGGHGPGRHGPGQHGLGGGDSTEQVDPPPAADHGPPGGFEH